MHIILKITLHLFYWLIYFLFAASLSFKLTEGAAFLMQNLGLFLANFIWAIFAFYGVYFFLYKFFEQKRFIVYFAFVSLFSIVLTTVCLPLIIHFFSIPEEVDASRLFYTTAPGTFIIANCGSLLRGFIMWFDTAQEKLEIEKRSLQHELESLRSQVNPHFLFNTLNNIDTLIHIDPPTASESLLKLSHILRYMLYGTEKGEVSLRQEIEHIQHMVELQKLRLKNTHLIKFHTEGITDGVRLAPLLFTPFVENAFKYAKPKGKTPMVEIYLSYKDQSVVFRCTNTYSDETLRNNEKGGIGLRNVKRRLELLYKDKYSLKTTKETDIFDVHFKIELS